MTKNKNNQPIWSSRIKKNSNNLFRKVLLCRTHLVTKHNLPINDWSSSFVVVFLFFCWGVWNRQNLLAGMKPGYETGVWIRGMTPGMNPGMNPGMKPGMKPATWKMIMPYKYKYIYIYIWLYVCIYIYHVRSLIGVRAFYIKFGSKIRCLNFSWPNTF